MNVPLKKVLQAHTLQPVVRPLSLGDVTKFKQDALDRAVFYPSGVKSFAECPYRYVYDKRNGSVSSPAQEKGKRIHAAIGKALDMPDNVCCPLPMDVAHITPVKEVLECGLTKLHKAEFFGTFEAEVTGEWNGITLGGHIDFLVQCQRHTTVTTEVVDIKTMSRLRCDVIEAYLESIQFSWYAFLTDAWRVYCWPILSTDVHEKDGVLAVRSALAYVKEHPEQCIKTVTNSKQWFEEVCAVPLERYVEWLSGNKMADKTPNKWCSYCNAFKDRMCKGR